MYSRLSLPICLLLTGLLLPGGSHAQDQSVDARLEGLDRVAREAIAHRCLPLQLDDSAEGYRACVNEALSARTERAGAVLDTLSFDDRYAVEQVCAGDPNATPDNVQSCIDTQISRLVDTPEPFLGVLDEDERRAVKGECADSQTRDGVAGYRRCLTEVLAAVETLPAPDLTALTPRERSIVAKRCSADTRFATAYRRCLVEASGDESDIALANRAVTDAGRGIASPADEASEPPIGAVDPEADDLAEERPAAAVVDAVTSDEGADVAADVDLDLDVDVDAEAEDSPPREPGQLIGDARARLDASVAGLDKVERIVLTAAAALPILLLLIWFLTRGSRARTARARQADHVPVRNHDLADRLRGASDWMDDSLRLDATPARDASMTAPMDSSLDLPSTEPDPEHSLDATLDVTVPEHRVAQSDDDPFDEALVEDFDGSLGESLKFAAERSSSPSPVTRDIAHDAGEQPDTGFAQTPAPVSVPLADFGQWIESAEPTLRLQHAIEFLIYWMAYGDERYEPETRDRLLRFSAGGGGAEGDEHDLIKRRVLEQDIDAFGDTIRWLQRNSGELQRIQIIDLLMVLLISDRAMTPVQNTLLRFLADAFGLGADALDERYDFAFGEPMPPLPRVDLADWWAGVGADELLRWDARAVAMLDPQEQYRSRLGLPLRGDIGETDIVEGFRRAARRCHPHRFDALGERECGLAERQFGKFEEARDKLLGVNA